MCSLSMVICLEIEILFKMKRLRHAPLLSDRLAVEKVHVIVEGHEIA